MLILECGYHLFQAQLIVFGVLPGRMVALDEIVVISAVLMFLSFPSIEDIDMGKAITGEQVPTLSNKEKQLLEQERLAAVIRSREDRGQLFDARGVNSTLSREIIE